ncbi:MAG: hypothetical protein AAF151_12725 [Cyanobacteria bacterium J06656_5]
MDSTQLGTSNGSSFGGSIFGGSIFGGSIFGPMSGMLNDSGVMINSIATTNANASIYII